MGGLVAILLLLVRVPQPKREALTAVRNVLSTLDLVGFALFAPTVIQLLLALQYGGNQFAWHSATVIGLFCGAGVTGVIFLVWEYFKGDAAMMPFSMISQRTVWSSCLVFGFQLALTFTASYYLPIYFQAVKGVSPMLSGVYLLPSVVMQTAMVAASGTIRTSLS